jgi:tetratricopeptide (TPR) repeat protein
VNQPNLTRPTNSFVAALSRVKSYLEKQWLRCLVLAIAGFAVRIPALQGQPIWDDDYLTRANPFIKSPLFVLEVFRHHLFPESYSAHYRPVQNISYIADYFLWNGNFYGFHLSSVLFHVAAGVLLYLLLRKLFTTLVSRNENASLEVPVSRHGYASWFAFFVALLWVVHPVHSAAVDYVSGRADSLGVFFGCSAWLLFMRARKCELRGIRWSLFFASWFIGLLALCSRESACLWPFIFLLYLFAFERSMKPWQRWVTVTACLFLFATYYGLRQLPSGRPVDGPSSGWSAELRGILMLRALGDYGRLMFFPSNLHMERTVFSGNAFGSEKGREAAIEFEYLSLGGLALVAGLVWLCSRRGPGQRARIFGAAWFIMAYLPTSNLVELNATVAEHWLYLPSIGFIIFVAGCIMDLPLSWRRVSAACACAAVLALGVRSAIRSSDWESNETFARRTIATGGATVRVALLLGQVYLNRGDYAEAETLFRKALKLCPEYPTARNNLATALVKEGKEKEAEGLFVNATKDAQEMRKDYPRTWIAALNLAHMREDQHNRPEAIVVLERARQNYPNTWELVRAETELLREDDQIGAAMGLILPFAEKNWWHHDAWTAIGRLYAQQGRTDEASAALSHASWLDIHETDALNLLALVRMRQHRMADAVTTQQRAVSRQPDQPQQYLLLSNLLDKAGRADEARTALGQVTRLRSVAGAGNAAN